MMLSDKENLVGKLVQLPSSKYDDNMVVFGVVMGYDFLEKLYIVKTLHTLGGHYEKLKTPDGEPKTYLASEVIDILNKCIADEEENKKMLKYSFTDKLGRNLRNNEANEVKRLFNVYKEILRQIDIYTQYIAFAEKSFRSWEATLYKHHLSKSQRALHRISKRFYYYFGENGKKIQEILRTYSCFSDIKYADRRIDEKIRKYRAVIDKIDAIRV